MKKNNRDRVTELYKTHRSRMIGYATKEMKTHEGVSDVVQEAFIRLIKYLEKLDFEPDDKHMEALIVKMTHQVAQSELRKRAIRNHASLIEEKDVPDEMDVANNAVNKVYAELQCELLRDTLDEDHLDILMLKTSYDYSAKEIAEIHDLKPNYVNQIVMRTKNRARKILGLNNEKED